MTLALLDRFVLADALGAGGGGTIYRARDLDRGADVALKVVPTADEAAARALLREFSLLRGVRHPNLVEVFDFGVATHDGVRVAFLAMEHVDGHDLATYAHTASTPDLVRALIGLARGLAASHRLGFVHGDVKPTNAVVDREGQARLIDFGASEAARAARPSDELSGTPAFMAPELFSGSRPDVRTDVFSFGRTLHALAPLRPPDQPIGRPLLALADRCASDARTARPATMDEVLEVLADHAPRAEDARIELPLRFVGRARELAELDRAIASLPTAGPRLLWIQGPPGSGKSRLLAEARWRAAAVAPTRELRALAASLPASESLVDALASLERGDARVVVADDVDAGSPLRARVDAIARVIAPTSRLTVVAASTDPPPAVDAEVLLHLRLEPLDLDDIAELLAGRAGVVAPIDVARITGGAASQVVAIARRLAAGDVDEVEIVAAARAAAGASAPRARASAVHTALLELRAARRTSSADAARVDVVGALLAVGENRRALRALRPLLSATGDVASEHLLALGARGLDVASRALARAGRFDLAADLSLAGLACTPDDEHRARLLGTRGVALAYLARDDEARAVLESAITVARAAGLKLDEARARIQLGIVAYRAGHASDAAASFEAAIAMAEPLDALDLVANASLNLGIARHQLGDLALALAAYDRGELVARALGSVELALAIGANLAKLHVDLGQFDRGLARATRVRDRALASGTAAYAAFAESIRADALAYLGDRSGAEEALDAAERAYTAMGASREVCEVTLERARLHVQAGELVRADALLRGARDIDAADLSARLALEDGRLERARGNAAAELAHLERAVERAAASRQRVLQADAHAALADAYRAKGALLLEERERAATRAILERTWVTLPPEIAESFAAHPARRAVLDRVHAPERRGSSIREARLERLVAIARRLSSTLDPKAVLEMAVDAAIDFAGAERGFVILRDATLTLLAPRNMGERALDEPDVAFSRGIAERVLETGEPIITVDAQRDERFAMQRSIHAMRLSSVMGVPVRGPGGVLAALYLDHRTKRGAFDEAEMDLVLALADHVATALSSARLHAALEERSRELEIERARTLELLREKSEEADRLALEVRAREEAAAERFKGSKLVGRSAPMQKLFEKIARVASTAVSVLITGESGTGKELVARAIHAESPRAARPFVAINCGAIPEQLLESELFGYRAGAFTGATKDRDGLFLAANGGTLFLDEIGEMAPALQVKLLRVLQNREVQALGAPAPVPIDVRLLTATHRDLRAETAAARFREDLYYRVAVVEISVPSLRDRLDDLVWLTPALLDRAASDLGRAAPEVSRDAMAAMLKHDWPGNVRELENALTKAMVLADRAVIRAADLGLEKDRAQRRAGTPLTRKSHEADEERRIDAALRAANFNVAEACRALGMPRATMYRRLRKRGAT